MMISFPRCTCCSIHGANLFGIAPGYTELVRRVGGAVAGMAIAGGLVRQLKYRVLGPVDGEDTVDEDT